MYPSSLVMVDAIILAVIVDIIITASEQINVSIPKTILHFSPHFHHHHHQTHYCHYIKDQIRNRATAATAVATTTTTNFFIYFYYYSLTLLVWAQLYS